MMSDQQSRRFSFMCRCLLSGLNTQLWAQLAETANTSPNAANGRSSLEVQSSSLMIMSSWMMMT